MSAFLHLVNSPCLNAPRSAIVYQTSNGFLNSNIYLKYSKPCKHPPAGDYIVPKLWVYVKCPRCSY